MAMSELVGPVEVGGIAHGGHCVARWNGRVLFVRHALPGELVRVRLTRTTHDRYWFGDAVEILRPSADRVPEPCPIAAECGGCDFQHVELGAQRALKAQVLAEQLRRLAGIDWDVTVQPLTPEETGLGWRTRMRYLVQQARVGLRGHHSGQVVELPDVGCLLADPVGPGPAQLRSWASGRDKDELIVATAESGVSVLTGSGEVLVGSRIVTERVDGRAFRVATDDFWQVHRAAAPTLVHTVLELLQPQPGESALDLYCGVGLFAGALIDAGCGPVTGVDANRTAIGLARRNVPKGRFLATSVSRAGRSLPRHSDLVVLDPPRTGAGRVVLGEVLRRNPRAVCYVACDPAALARDVATAAVLGYRLTRLVGWDMFPMTHHVEAVALLERAPVGDPGLA